MKRFVFTLTCFLLVAACTTTGDPPLLRVTLKPIVDKATAQPIMTNTITCTWYSAQGEVIKTEKYQDHDNLELTVAGDGESRLEILVESPGYNPWTLGLRTKLKKNKHLITPVELMKKSLQGN